MADITKSPGVHAGRWPLAAAIHPMLHLFWLEKHNYRQLSSAQKAVKTAMETALRETSEEGSTTTSNEDEKDDVFSSMTQPQMIKTHKSQGTQLGKDMAKGRLEGGPE